MSRIWLRERPRRSTLANHFDVDRDPQYVAKSADPAVATATEANGILTVTPIASGTTNVTVTASKGGNDAISQAFSVTVAEPPPTPPTPPTPVNNPPVIRTYIDDMSIQVGMTKMLTLSEYYLDIDSLVVTYSAASSDDAVATVSDPDGNSMITITAVAEGSATITVSASDREGLAIPQTFDVTVSATPVEPPDNNQPRQTRDIPALTGTDALKFGGSQDVDLSMYFTDDDGDDVTYTADSTDPNVVTADVSGSMVTVTVVAPGMAMIDVTAADPYNRSVRGSFDVEVINQGPMIQADEPATFGPFMPGATQDILLSRYFSDPEGESLMYTAMSDMPDYVKVSAVGADSTITITAVAAGTAMITITANDGTNDGMSHTLTVTVAPVANNPPMVKPGVAAPAVALVVEGQSNTLMLSTYFLDADADDTLTYTVTTSDPLVATASELDGVLTIMPKGGGTAKIKVTASDGEATSEPLVISVTVRAAANLMPRVTGDGLPDLKMVVDGVETIDLADFFEDDSPRLFYKVTSDDSAETKIDLAGGLNVGGNMVDMSPQPNGTDFASMLHIQGKDAGTVTVTVVATDFGNKSVTDEFMVDVIAAAENDPPVTGSGDAIAAMTDSGSRLKVGESETVIDGELISLYFADPNLKNGGTDRRDGELLTFEVRYFAITAEVAATGDSNTEQLAAEDRTVSHSLSAMTWDGTSDSKFTLTLTGVKANTDGVKVVLVATDEYGESFAHTFAVQVNHPPKAEGAQATPKTLSGETAFRSLTWDQNDNGRPVVLVAESAGYFTDADDDMLTCSYVQSPEPAPDGDAPAVITLADNTLTITPAKQTGTMSVEVTCSDDDSGSASDTLQIGVVGKTFSVR